MSDEIARLEILEGGKCKWTVQAGYFKEKPMCWGLAMADLLITLSKAVADCYRVPEAQASADILEMFDKELARPTTEVKLSQERTQ